MQADDDFADYVAPEGVMSPCTGICRLDPATGWCLGCGRTGQEIAAWRDAGDDERRAILNRLDQRMTVLAQAGSPAGPN
ncbi:DUF1289 domain-containing protein [Sphingomonas sp. BGYR3]|uniref:DUF1289 domain-containing protein n=1 Tax=Sphingomonas sp. BGYR3 TaxID=2975483 RepID=UPI0021A78FF2|nr:DUF1289 domain-containing protein [Sphingomonas sp. BGYR3]MDG5488285.1 DUF1289 domain-containing protein [Sphingomonas sp. BGYR3]